MGFDIPFALATVHLYRLFCVRIFSQIEKMSIFGSRGVSSSKRYIVPVSDYLVMFLLKSGIAMAVKTIPNAASTAISVDMAGMPAPRTMTFLRAVVA
jgi:hypothetical protein